MKINNTSYWLKEPAKYEFPPLKEDITVDVCVVGGGITGITTAYLLSQLDYSVCLIEANKLFSGTSGLTTAKITTQHGLIYDEFIQQKGVDNARKYYDSNNEAKTFIENTINKHNISCNLEKQASYLYTRDEKGLEKLEAEAKAYEQLNIKSSLTYNENDLLPFKVLGLLKIENQALFHPVHYLQSLLDQCRKNNVKIYENTRAIGLQYMKRPTVVCERDFHIVSDYVVQASHYPFYDGTEFFPLKMYANRSYAIAAQVKNKLSGMFINVDSPTHSIRPLTIDEGEAIIVAGENHRTGDDQIKTSEQFNNLEQFLRESFHPNKILNYWSAQDYTTLDNLPYVGQITEDQPNVFVATGYRKWGMTNGTNAALMICDLIMEKENPYKELYAPDRKATFDPSIKHMFSFNAKVAKELIKGKLSIKNDSFKQLKQKNAIIKSIDGNRIGIYKDENNQLFAVDTTCTHLGCELQWNDAETSWDCPCHGSRFTYEGKIINGPAKKPLRQINIKN